MPDICIHLLKIALILSKYIMYNVIIHFFYLPHVTSSINALFIFQSPWNQFFQDNELRLTIKQDVIRT